MTNDQPSPVTHEMLTRFLSWQLPDDFQPDCHIYYMPPKGATNPTGTNLFTENQARQMLEHVLGGDAWKRRRITPTFAPVVAVEPSNREAAYESLLRAAAGQLRAWHQKYGNHAPSWLPPGGDVSLLETIDDWLDTNTTSTQPEPTLKATP